MLTVLLFRGSWNGKYFTIFSLKSVSSVLNDLNCEIYNRIFTTTQIENNSTIIKIVTSNRKSISFYQLLKPDFGLPSWLRWSRICMHCKRPWFHPWVRKIPWKREWLLTPVFLPRESHGQRSLVGYGLWGRKGLDRSESNIFTFLFKQDLFLMCLECLKHSPYQT